MQTNGLLPHSQVPTICSHPDLCFFTYSSYF